MTTTRTTAVSSFIIISKFFFEKKREERFHIATISLVLCAIVGFGVLGVSHVVSLKNEERKKGACCVCGGVVEIDRVGDVIRVSVSE